MAEFNSCAALLNDEKVKFARDKYAELLKEGKDPLGMIFEMQHALQEELGKNSKGLGGQNVNELDTLAQKYAWLRDNKIALDDEYREVIDALPGMNTPEKERSGIWKTWKKNHAEIGSKTFENLTDDEIKELRFEYIDMLHFFVNMAFALGIDAETVFVYYYYKNAENFNRIKNLY